MPVQQARSSDRLPRCRAHTAAAPRQATTPPARHLVSQGYKGADKKLSPATTVRAIRLSLATKARATRWATAIEATRSQIDRSRRRARRRAQQQAKQRATAGPEAAAAKRFSRQCDVRGRRSWLLRSTGEPAWQAEHAAGSTQQGRRRWWWRRRWREGRKERARARRGARRHT
jgi:hypothetical protein